MARPYGQKFLMELEKNESPSLGVKLAKVCIRANLPASYVAAALETTRVTVYGWFRGQGIRENKLPSVEAFIKLVEGDIEAGRLPAKDIHDAKVYIETLAGVRL